MTEEKEFRAGLVSEKLRRQKRKTAAIPFSLKNFAEMLI